ncbi:MULTISPECIES: hypothetical protein [Micrococcaceae]|uniref:hypothetical protein n=1 Tax=Micrococcaceae TaxID=1268 RepID=UPI0006D2C474|nr:MULTISPECIES: hypothetical protein [Micrococcaceae]
MEYFGVFLVLVAAGLRLVGDHLAKPGPQPRATATMRGVHSVPPRAAALLIAASGIFIFVVSISSR